jgi:hypothetical protein
MKDLGKQQLENEYPHMLLSETGQVSQLCPVVFFVVMPQIIAGRQLY